MTAPSTIASRQAAVGPLHGVIDVVRIYLVNKSALWGWPWLIIAFTFAVNWVIFEVGVHDVDQPDRGFTGALVSLYIVVGVSHLQSVVQLFPFVLGISLTRRAFYLGSFVVIGMQAALFGLAVTLLGLVEQASGGWGIGMNMFSIPALREPNFFAQWVMYAVPFVGFSAVFVLGGVVFKRWGQPGIWIATIALGSLITAAVVVIGWQQWWPAVFRFFGSQSAFGLLAGYPLVLGAVAGGVGFLLLRRATP